MKLTHHARKKPKVEIVPLIDIMFFLFATLLMVTMSMTKNEGISVALPGASTSSKPSDEKDSVTLSVTEKGDVFYNKEKCNIAQVGFKLQTLKNSVKDPRIVVNADAGADFKNIVTVLDEARKIGIQKIGISTVKK